MAICFFFLQLLQALPSSTSSSAAESGSSSFLSLFYFRPFAFECVSTSFDDGSKLVLSLIVVFMIPVACVVSGVVSYVWTARSILEAQKEEWRAASKFRSLEFGWTLYQLVYLPVAQTTVSTFNCRTDNGPASDVGAIHPLRR